MDISQLDKKRFRNMYMGKYIPILIHGKFGRRKTPYETYHLKLRILKHGKTYGLSL